METRMAQHYMQLLQTVSTDEFVRRTSEVHDLKFDDFDSLLEFRRNHDEEIHVKYDAYMAWVNGFGHMLKEGLIDKEMIHSFGQGIQYIRAWDKWKPVFLEYREKRNLPQYMSGLEYLAEEMKKSRIERGWPSKWSEEIGMFVAE